MNFFEWLDTVFTSSSVNGVAAGAKPQSPVSNNPKKPKEGVHMNRMNRREFFSVLGGASAVSVMGASVFASTSADKVAADVTPLYVKGLVMVDQTNPDRILLGFPK